MPRCCVPEALGSSWERAVAVFPGVYPYGEDVWVEVVEVVRFIVLGPRAAELLVSGPFRAVEGHFVQSLL